MIIKYLLILIMGSQVPTGINTVILNDIAACEDLGQRIVKSTSGVYKYKCFRFSQKVIYREIQ